MDDEVVEDVPTQDIDDGKDLPGKTNRPRTTPVQQDIFLDFATKHPCVLDKLSKDYTAKWKVLTNQLNEKGPQRSVRDWQDVMKNWEYQVTHKFKHREKRGNPSEKEKRALAVFGKIRDTGFQGTRLGYGLPNLSVPDVGESSNVTEAATALAFPAAASSEALVDEPEEETLPTIPRKRPRTCNSERMNKVIEILSEQQRRDADRQRIDEQRLEVDRRNAQSWSDFAEAAKTLTGVLANIFPRN